MTERERDWSEPDTHSNAFPPDTAFDLLISRQRRDVLRFLMDHAGTIGLQELADQLVACETTTAEDRERTVTSLYHTHLSKLNDAGVLTFDADQQLIELEERADALKPYLELAAKDRVQADEAYPECK
ncbi:DUF7344 domain-containing protein [Halogeometricum borinquense]